MNDLQILSTFQELPPESGRRVPAAVLVFDACRVGVALRAVLFVEIVVGVAAMFGAATFSDWLTRWSVFTGAALPGTLVWLITACGLKNLLAPMRSGLQHAAGVALGAIAGLGGCTMLYVAGWQEPVPWLASACAGALLAALLVLDLLWRQRSIAPAETKARLNELQSRIRPPFLFNTLNSAIALVRAEPAKAEALLENAVKHGVEPSASGAQISIVTQRRGSRVVIKVINTVPAGQGESGSGLALDNVRDRLGLLHDVQCQFGCVMREGIFQVRIEVPL